MASNKIKGLIFVSITASLWGFLAIIMKVSLSKLSPIDITWFRFSIAFIILLIYTLLTKKSELKIIVKPPKILVFAALCLGVNYFGFTTGVYYTTPSVAQIFIQLGPILLAILGIIIYKEKITLSKALGFIVVLSGLYLFYNEQLSVALNGEGFNKGVAFVIMGAIAWASYAIMQKKLVMSYSASSLNLVIFGLPALLYTPFVNYHIFLELSALHWGIVIFMGLNTLGAYGFLALALKYIEANTVSVVVIQNPIITFVTMAILGYLNVSWIQYEEFTLLTIIGAVLVLLGGIITIVFSKKK